MESPRPLKLKRDHDTYESSFGLEEPFSVPAEYLERIKSGAIDEQEQEQEQVQQPVFNLPMPKPTQEHPVQQPTFNLPMPKSSRDPSPARSTSGSVLSELGGTPSNEGNSPNPKPSAFTAMNGSAPPPAKRAKLTFAEKEEQRVLKQIRDHEKAVEKARKDAERQAVVEEKARKEEERRVEKAAKDAEKQALVEEKARKEEERKAEKVAKDKKAEEVKRKREEDKQKAEELKRKREEDKQKAEELKRKKERMQPTLGSFFKIPAAATAKSPAVKSRSGSVGSRERTSMSPAPQNSNPTPAGAAASQTVYGKMFPNFFVHHDVRVAAVNRFERDQEATEVISKTIDGYMIGDRSPGRQRSFDAAEIFHLPGMDAGRGKRCMPVREIMAEFSGKAERPIDLTTDSQNSQIKRKQDLLREIPMKFLCFREDVRPPYRGTYTSRPVNGISKLARNPLRKDLPNTDYDYDSEAEWVEDEDAEDCNSDGEEEEEAEDGEDMEGFLDDENDELNQSKRMVMQGDLEPVSTGLCWENERKKTANVKMLPYRMEIIVDQKLKSIDPFSTAYWATSTTTTIHPPRQPLTTLKVPNSNNNNSLPSTAPKSVKPLALTSQPTASASASTKPKKLLPPEDLPRFKKKVEGNNLTKVGLVEVLKKEFPNATAAAVRGTLDTVAKRVGAKEADKRWVIVEGM